MKVLMFGWEFPPLKSGGLGTACYDLTKGLSKQGVDVTFVMPTSTEGVEAEFVNLVGTDKLSKNIKIKKIKTILTPYATSQSYDETFNQQISKQGTKGKEAYGENLYEEVYRYGEVAKFITEQAMEEGDFDVVHAHDWMTYKAGINAREISGKPLVVHIHASEYDRTAGNPNPFIRELEFEGLDAADMIIANSNFTKNNVVRDYGISPDKIEVVHWGIDPHDPKYHMNFRSELNENNKIVMYMGRITVQKGVEYFVRAARKVLDYIDDVKFVVAGDGDMLPRIIQETAELGLTNKFLFTGWLKGTDPHKAMQMADLFIMPSVSEPFGLQAVEAMANNTPVIVSKQSGASEVIKHALKVDFWDVDELANKIIGVLRHPEAHHELSKNSYQEIKTFNLEEPAKKCVDCYQKVMGGGRQ